MTNHQCSISTAWSPIEVVDGELVLNPFRLLLPLLKGYRGTFQVSPVLDLFDARVSEEVRDRIFGIMLAAQLDRGHRFALLTRHAEEMQRYLAVYGATLLSRWAQAGDRDVPEEIFNTRFSAHVASLSALKDGAEPSSMEPYDGWPLLLPLKSLALGVYVETQDQVDERVPRLNDTPAASRFVHAGVAEPLDFSRPVMADRLGYYPFDLPAEESIKRINMLDLVVIDVPEGECDEGLHATGVDLLILECQRASVPYVEAENERMHSAISSRTRSVKA